ncbi:MAG: methyltransferase domain-containing protein, partial [Desulfobacteraceae bacterium]
MKTQAIAKGLLTLLPGSNLLPKGKTGGTNAADYCYAVWIKHLTMLYQSGLHSMPDTLAELGPGDSLGIGLAAILSGVNHCYALDVVKYSNPDSNLRIFDQLVGFFRTHAKIRSNGGWPDFYQHLGNDLFPSHILTEDLLRTSLSEERVQRIRDGIKNPESQDERLTIKYIVPWSDAGSIVKESVDVIVSQSVMEHVTDLDSTYRCLYLWLKPGGMMSHQIDFKSHGLSKEWNGYRSYSERTWKIITGNRPYLLNRQPGSVHVELMKKNGFRILCHL